MESKEIEGLLLKQKKGLTGTSWKNHWVKVTADEFIQYSTDKPNKSKDKPKYILNLCDCTIEKDTIKKYSFKLVYDNNEVFIYALNDSILFDQWFSIINNNIIISSNKNGTADFDEDETVDEEEEDSNESNSHSLSDDIYNNEDYENTKTNIIKNFFTTKNQSNDNNNPCVELLEIKNLFHMLDASLNTGITETILAKDCGLKPGDMLSHQNFTAWWSANSAYVEPVISITEYAGKAQTDKEPVETVKEPVENEDDSRNLKDINDIDDDIVEYPDEPKHTPIKQFSLGSPSRSFKMTSKNFAAAFDEADAASTSNSSIAPAVFTASILPGIAAPLASLAPFDDPSTNPDCVSAFRYVSPASFSVELETSDSVHFAGFIGAPAISAMEGRSAYFVRAGLPVSSAINETYEDCEVVHHAGRTFSEVNDHNHTSDDQSTGHDADSKANSNLDAHPPSLHYAAQNNDEHSNERSLAEEVKSEQDSASKSSGNDNDDENADHSDDDDDVLGSPPSAGTRSNTNKEDFSDSQSLASRHRIKIDEDNWNNMYQAALDSALSARFAVFSTPDSTTKETEAIEKALSYCYFKSEFYRIASEGVRCIVDEYPLPDSMKTAIRISDVPPEKLTEKAAELAKAIVTAKQNNSESNSNPHDGEDTDPIADETCEVYFYRGLIFHVIGTPGSELDRKKGIESDIISREEKERIQVLSGQDALLHKMLGCEYRATSSMETAITALKTQYKVVDKWNVIRSTAVENDVENHDVIDENHTGTVVSASKQSVAKRNDEELVSNGSPNRSLNKPLPNLNSFFNKSPAKSDTKVKVDTPSTVPMLTTVLSTLVDFAGFRVSVVCPVELDDVMTLIHGPSTAMVEDEVFVSASKAFQTILPQIAAQLNLAVVAKKRDVIRSKLCDLDEDTVVNSETVQLISADMQAHECNDGRIYIVSLQSLLPSDLPRFESYDCQTRQLRPEFLLRNGMDDPIRSDALLEAMPPGILGEDNESIAAASVKFEGESSGDKQRRRSTILSQDISPEEEDWFDNSMATLQATAGLYRKILPYIASLLDSCAEMPIDSFGLTQLLHHQGANCRHLGLIYGLCRTPWAKHLLLSEAIGRSFKSVLNGILRQRARRNKGESLCAEHRGRSHQEDFYEYQDECIAQRSNLVLETFNLALGCSEATETFWNDSMCTTLKEKYGISASYKDISAQAHWPQVFIAMQYHSGTKFVDEAFLGLGSRYMLKNPFNLQHLVEATVPNMKLRLSVPGEIGYIDMLGESFLANGQPKSAVLAFKLRHMIQSSTILCDDSSQRFLSVPLKQLAVLGHTLYKLALSEYCAGDYTNALARIRTYISRFPRYHPVAGRMMTLLMSMEYRACRFNNAKAYFDAAQDIYSYTLGPNHPIISLHMSCLGDLYLESKAIAQAKVMHTLAYVSAKRSLGELHIVTAIYTLKVAAEFIEQKAFAEAKKLLRQALIALDAIAATAAGAVYFEFETMHCLYQLISCHIKCNEIDQAGKCALRCLDLVSRLKKYGLKILPITISCLVILSDLFISKNDINSAQEMLLEAWNKLKQCHPGSNQFGVWSGNAMLRISIQSLELTVNSLPMNERTLLESVASDWTVNLNIYMEQWKETIEKYRADLELFQTNENESVSTVTVGTEDLEQPVPTEYRDMLPPSPSFSPLGEMKKFNNNNKQLHSPHDNDNSEVHENKESDVASNVLPKPEPPVMVKQWEGVRELVASVLWRINAPNYLSLLIQGLQEESAAEEELRSKNKNKRNNNSRSSPSSGNRRKNSNITDKEILSLPLSAQAAMVMKLINQYSLNKENNISDQQQTQLHL